MEIRKNFTLSEEDFILILRDIISLDGSTPEKPKKPVGILRRYRKMIIGLFVFFTFMILIDDQKIVAAIVYYSVLAVYMAFVYFYLPYCDKVSARKQYQTSKILQKSQFVEMSSHGVVTGGEGYKETLDWSAIYKIEKGRYNFLIFFDSLSAIGIPLNLFSDDELKALEGYRDQLTLVSP